MNEIKVGIADAAIGKCGDELVTYALGSCVGVCLWDRTNETGGLLHIMLPDSSDSFLKVDNRNKFADTGIKDLIKELQAHSCRKENIIAKIAGGATMFKGSITFDIGNRNVQAVKKILKDLNIPITAEQTGGNFGRTLYFDTKTGSVQVKSAVKQTIVM